MRNLLVLFAVFCLVFGLFGGPPGPSATVRQPAWDEWVACSLQVVKISISDPDGIDPSTIVLVVGTDTLRFPDERLDFVYDSILIYTPTAPFANDVVYQIKLLEAEDNDGFPLMSAPVTSRFHTDFDSPYFYPESRYPPPDTVMTTTNFDISVIVYDQSSGIVDGGLCLCIDSRYHDCYDDRNSGFCWNPGMSEYVRYEDSTFTVDDSVIWFSPEEFVHVCLEKAVDMGMKWIDTLDPELCWDFLVEARAPRVFLDYPHEGDTIAYDSLVFHSVDFSQVDTAFTRLRIVDGPSFDCGVSSYLSSDGINYFFSGSAMGVYSQGLIRVQVDRIRDIIGNTDYAAPIWQFWVDKTPPYGCDPVPASGSTITQAQPIISLAISDSFSGVDPGSIILSVNESLYSYGHSALSWDGERLSFNCASAGISFGDEERVNVCLTSVADVVRPEYKGPNHLTVPYCFNFRVNLEGIHESTVKIPLLVSNLATPNPFNSTCRIDHPANTVVKIYDIRGQVVGTLSNGQNVWTPSKNLGSGIYFASVVALSGGQSSTAVKLVYLK